MAFETDFSMGPVNLEGEMTEVLATDDIIRLNEAWDVTLNWSLWGNALDPSAPVGLQDGEWIATAYLERIGSGAGSEIDLGPVTVHSDTHTAPAAPVAARPHERLYTAVFPVNNAALGVTPGVYRIAATVTYTLEDPPNTPARMAGFIEGAMVQIFDAP